MKFTTVLLCTVLSAVQLGVRAADSPEEIGDRRLAAGGEVASVLRETTSADGSIAMLFTARKKGVKPTAWPEFIRDFEPKTCDAIHNPAYIIENVVVSLREKQRIGTVKSAVNGWSPYWGASKADFSVLWGPEQEGWYYGLLCYNVGFVCDDLILVDVDGTAMRQWSIRATLDAAARKFMTTKAKLAKGAKLDSYAITYSLNGMNKVNGVSALLDPLTVRIGFVAQIPKGEADAIEGTMTVKLARSDSGPTTATILGIKAGHEEPDPRPVPARTLPPSGASVKAPAPANAPAVKTAGAPSLADFQAIRKDINAKTEKNVWKAVTKDLPNTEKGRRLYVKGWLESNVLQRLMHVDSRGEKDESVTFYYWREGQLTSVFQVRNGPSTRLKGVAECTETYNFVDGKMVAWKHTQDKSDTLFDTNTQGFADAAKRVFAESIKYSQPIYTAIGAD